MPHDLRREYEYYRVHRNELLQSHKGRFIVIKDAQVIGVYDSDLDAVERTSRTHELGTFLVQKCIPEGESEQIFRSRVAFS